MKRLRYLLPGAVLFLSAGHSVGFQSLRHEDFTLRAFGTYERCRLVASLPPIGRHLFEAFAFGARAEDETELVARAQNWHYHPKAGMPRLVWQFPLPVTSQPNLERILDWRIGELVGSASRASREGEGPVFVAAGRVLHFLQDMRVPAHVIPVHHGSLLGSDEGDGMELQLEPVTLTKQECEQLLQEADVAGPAQIRARLEAAAAMTLSSMKSPIAEGRACSWEEAFWCPPGVAASDECHEPPFPGFGTYRRNSHLLKFGQEGLLVCKGANYRFAGSDYESFMRPGYREMMKDTVFMALLARKLAR